MPGGLIRRRKFRNIRRYTAGECHLTTDAKIDALQLQGKERPGLRKPTEPRAGPSSETAEGA